MTNIITLPDKTIRDVALKRKFELFEVKQLAELEHVFQVRCKQALIDYKNWLKAHQDETDAVELLYGQLTGIVLRRHAEDAVQAYWIIRHDFRLVFHRYLDEHKPYEATLKKQKRA